MRKQKNKNQISESQITEPNLFNNYLDELFEIIEKESFEAENPDFSLQIFTSNRNEEFECSIGIHYGIRLICGEQVKWEQYFVSHDDSCLKSELTDFRRSIPLLLCRTIAIYFQESINLLSREKCSISYDLQPIKKEGYIFNFSKIDMNEAMKRYEF